MTVGINELAIMPFTLTTPQCQPHSIMSRRLYFPIVCSKIDGRLYAFPTSRKEHCPRSGLLSPPPSDAVETNRHSQAAIRHLSRGCREAEKKEYPRVIRHRLFHFFYATRFQPLLSNAKERHSPPLPSPHPERGGPGEGNRSQQPSPLKKA